jgi:hypothetical protein
MNAPEIIIPFALPPAEHARDLVKLLTSVCAPDGLALLLSRAHTLQRLQHDAYAPALPHEVWLARQTNPVTALQSRLNVKLSNGYWFILKPVNLHIASNHLVLTDYRLLELFAIAQSYFSQAGFELVYGDAGNWLLRADDWSDMETSSPDAACGHNIDIWSPKGPKARAWRKLQNDVQMEWFMHPLQEQRQLNGLKAINGLWLWSGTRIGSESVQQRTLYTNLSASELIQSPRLTELDLLSSAALASDWGSWAEIMQRLDQQWFKPLCAALKTRQLQQLHLVLSNTTTVLDVQASTGSLRRFWRSASFNHLLEQNK